MVPLLGIIIVVCSIAGGFALEGGHLSRLVQPAELLIICGGACGILLASNPLETLRKTGLQLNGVFRKPQQSKARYLSGLVMLRAIFDYARRYGATELENQVDHPARSILFQKHPSVSKDLELLGLVCDTLRLTTMTTVDSFDLQDLLDKEAEAREQELAGPAALLLSLADALPGLGIIAAVLGVVITMGSLHASPSVIGQKVGMALTGTFLGITLSYGLVGPLASHLTQLETADGDYDRMLRTTLAAYGKGIPPSIALEFGRRSIPPELRPDFTEMEAEFLRASRAAEKVLSVR